MKIMLFTIGPKWLGGLLITTGAMVAGNFRKEVPMPPWAPAQREYMKI